MLRRPKCSKNEVVVPKEEEEEEEEVYVNLRGSKKQNFQTKPQNGFYVRN
jgi:hypothetical protein